MSGCSDTKEREEEKMEDVREMRKSCERACGDGIFGPGGGAGYPITVSCRWLASAGLPRITSTFNRGYNS